MSAPERMGWPVRPPMFPVLPEGYELREDPQKAYLYAPDGRLVSAWPWREATPAAIEAAALRDLIPDAAAGA